jgi:hypothetical protein
VTDFNLRRGLRDGTLDLRVINSLTKYPSIPTFHKLTEGILADDDTVPFTGRVTVTEKVNGTNARLIIFPDGEVIVGSREELLYAAGDVVANSKLGIVETVHPRWTSTASECLRGFDSVYVVYGEVYGAGIDGAREYLDAGQRVTGFRVFDACRVPQDALLLDSAEKAAAWREHGGQDYAPDPILDIWCEYLGAPRVPTLHDTEAERLPSDVAEAGRWLEKVVPSTQVGLGERADGRAEGVVLRGWDVDGNRLLAKLRYEDVRRTLKRRAQ